MRDAYNKAEGRELYDDSKAWEKEFHLPKRDAERKPKRTQTSNKTRALQR